MADLTTHPTIVVVVRHGERLDYVLRDEGRNWVEGATKTNSRPYDPPLSDHGIEQASKLGKQLRTELLRLNLPPVHVVYSSPFLRCRQTAAAAVKAINQEEPSTTTTTTTATPPANQTNNIKKKVPPARIEEGLAESINESWYRSWCLPGSDGTWGYRVNNEGGNKDETILSDPSRLHPASLKPVQSLLDWKAAAAAEKSTADPSSLPQFDYDYEHKSKTKVERPFCLYPRLLESRKDQRQRMFDTVNELAENGRTIVLVSHGGPVTHLYEKMTGNKWDVHGESTYCCYSIYQLLSSSSNDANGYENNRWDAIAVNESKFLHERLVAERHVSSDTL